jgi:hypothetical protein
MTEATYDGAFAPIPWRVSSEYRPDRGAVVHSVVDGLGGIVAPDLAHGDATLIVTAVNLLGAVRAASQLIGGGGLNAILAPTVAQPEAVPEEPPVDLEVLATKTRDLAMDDGWDTSGDALPVWSRDVAYGADVRPGPMSKERWAEFTEKALKELSS